MYVVKKNFRDSLGWSHYSFLDEQGRFSNKPKFFTKEEAMEESKKYPQSYAWEWGIDKWMN